ncbi:MAG: CRISPR system precrRNA processing endoribonuclease RAMP protein Cas6 [bacterium]|nr:CRISPR system precrRNA processing endoribonuclease RAMP protein Cas6 [bacterium]
MLEQLQLAKYSFKLVFSGKDKLPAYSALGLRGLLGHQLQKVVCPLTVRQRDSCKTCFIRRHCPYFNLYEQQCDIRGRKEAPKGYILYCPPHPRGNEVEVEVTLMGRSNVFFSALFAAIKQAEKTGLGLRRERRRQYRVSVVSRHFPGGSELLKDQREESTPPPFPVCQWLDQAQSAEKAYFVTPVRLTKKRESVLNWNLLYTNLARRLESLNMVYGSGAGFGRDNWLELRALMQDWPAPSARLHWVQLHRYSARQDQKIPLGGFIGQVDLSRLRPEQQIWWHLASLLHVGRGTVMGLGRIELS